MKARPTSNGSIDQSLQWAAFQRLVKLLQSRGNDVLVVVGPFNEHIMAAENRPAFRRLRDGIADWLAKLKRSNTVVLQRTTRQLPAALESSRASPRCRGEGGGTRFGCLRP